MAAPIAPDGNSGTQCSRLIPREPVSGGRRSGWQDRTALSETKQGSSARSRAGGEAPRLFIGSSLGKDLGAEKHRVYGLCTGPKQPRDGDNRVVPVPSTLQEWLSPGHVAAKASLAWGNEWQVFGDAQAQRGGTWLEEMEALQRVKDTRSVLAGNARHEACPPKLMLSAWVNFWGRRGKEVAHV